MAGHSNHFFHALAIGKSLFTPIVSIAIMLGVYKKWEMSLICAGKISQLILVSYYHGFRSRIIPY